jgi:type I restriction enzyme, R subunit
MPAYDGPERRARLRIDAGLTSSGWIVQNRDEINVSAARGVAIREFKMEPGYGYADYLLFADGRSIGALEAKKGYPLTGVEPEVKRYSDGLPGELSTSAIGRSTRYGAKCSSTLTPI